MIVIFCSDPIEPKQVEDLFMDEAEAVTKQGIVYGTIDYDALVRENDSRKAVRRLPKLDSMTLGIYRGWMLKPNEYETLYELLAAKNIHLINAPHQYLHCHHFPHSYPLIKNKTPKSVWLEPGEGHQIDLVMEKLSTFGDSPVILKDYVKSCKHDWKEACYISSASNRSEVQRVVDRFQVLQSDDLNGNLVFREFIEFDPIGEHAISGMPLIKEYRLFILEWQVIHVSPYWEGGEYHDEHIPIEQFTEVIQNIKSWFFTMDIACTTQGDWMIIELGDGQVSGIPANADLNHLYREISKRKIPIFNKDLSRSHRLRLYDEKTELTKYILRYFQKYLTKMESLTLSIASVESKVRTISSARIASRLMGRFSKEELIEAEKHLQQGHGEYQNKVTQRILQEHAEEIIVNRCPQCGRIVTTPTAKQCLWCGHDWHHDNH